MSVLRGSLRRRAALVAVVLGLATAIAAPAADAAPRIPPSVPGQLSFWAFLEGPATTHRFANSRSRVVARLRARTPEGTNELVAVLSDAENANGERWYKVRLPTRPNNQTAWVAERHLGELYSTRKHLIIDRARLTARLVEGGRTLFRASIGVGKSQWPTPAGSFYVRSRLPNSFGVYGPLAFGTSATSPVLTDWPGGGYIGLHGTNQPSLLPGRVSHGCIRFRNHDILRLGRLLGVGTPITIV